MSIKNFVVLSILIFTTFFGKSKSTEEKVNVKILEKDNLFAWCIIPYDNQNRTPLERAEMLLELGIKSYAYDWRPEHLPNMANELRIMKSKNIGLTAVWFWIDGKEDSFFDEYNEYILKTLKEENIITDIWIGIREDYFKNFDDNEKLKKAVELIDYTHNRAKQIGCTISLYNHGGWFGEPENQVRIIEALGYDDIGIIYNFHHAHDQIDSIAHNFILMKKYLRAININGMKKEGPKILPVGEGNEEINMLKQIIKLGYDGPIGILGHVENVDVKEVLLKNLLGVQKIKSQL